MRIYSMTATFGKLEKQTLSLTPGLNIIHAPNEWGKSTWCAFLIAMLYGLDTRSKSTKAALSDREHYMPWSGSPMSGRIDLCWNGRDITIERSTKGRTPLGVFRAYETQSGLEVPELNGTNCGQMLLGVEQSVYRRAGFIRQSDLLVTPDDSLRRRLQALVSTGEDAGEYAGLEKGLRELKNKCRYNKSGLIPQAEAELAQINQQIADANQCSDRLEALTKKLEENRTRQADLENHLAAIQAAQLHTAQEALEQATDVLEARKAVCKDLPDKENCRKRLAAYSEYRQAVSRIDSQLNMLPQSESTYSPEEAAADSEKYYQLRKKQFLLPILAVLCLIGAAVAFFLKNPVIGICALVTGLVMLGVSAGIRRKKRQLSRTLEIKYGSSHPERWQQAAASGEEAAQTRMQLEAQRKNLHRKWESLSGGADPMHNPEALQNALRQWELLENAQLDVQRCRKQLDILSAILPSSQKPQATDTLSYSLAQTQQLLSDLRLEQQHLTNLLGQYRGRLESIGQIAAMQQKKTALEQRIQSLNKAYAALSLAQDTFAQASAQLQRRFAPKITQRAQKILETLTEGRYDRLSLGEDFSLRSGTVEETTIQDALWRSEGTIDQLHLSVRLAIAQELTPTAPLILDDALVRFDDRRMAAAMKLLAELGKEKQIILFSCQGREALVEGLHEKASS